MNTIIFTSLFSSFSNILSPNLNSLFYVESNVNISGQKIHLLDWIM